MSLKIIKKVNLIFFVIFLLAIFGLLVSYAWLEKKNSPRALGLSNLWSDLAGQFNRPVIADSNSKKGSSDKKSANIKEGNRFLEAEDVKILASERSLPIKSLLETKRPEEKISRFTFVGIGDSEAYDPPGYNEELEVVLQATSHRKPEFALFTGDVITTGAATLEENQARIEGAKEIIEKYYQDYYIAVGNHDIECGEDCLESWGEVFLSKESPLYYSFDYGNTHFTVLFTGGPAKEAVDKEQLEWLEKDLSDTRKANKIVVSHIPPVTFFKKSAKECHDLSCLGNLSSQLVEIFQVNQVDLVISGHENAFDHKIVSGVDFVLSGNVGNSRKYDRALKGNIYTVFQVEEESIRVQGIRLGKEGEEILRDIKIK